MIRSMLGIALCCLVSAAGATRLSASADCFATIATGNGAAFFSVCLSDHGNVINFETPQGYDQAISGDGYVLCSAERLLTTTHGWDAGGYGEEGFGPALIDQPNGANTLPLRIVRVTTDGIFELTQTVQHDGAEKDLRILMQVRNLTGAPRSLVRLARFLRMSPNRSVETGAGQGENNATRTADSVLLWDDSNDDPPQGPAYGVGLTALSYGVRHRVVVEDHDDWNPEDSDGPQRAEGCLPIPKNNTPYLGLRDLQGRVTYELGTIGAGQSSRVSFLYRHF